MYIHHIDCLQREQNNIKAKLGGFKSRASIQNFLMIFTGRPAMLLIVGNDRKRIKSYDLLQKSHIENVSKFRKESI